MISKILIISLVVCIANAEVWMGRLPEKPKEFAHKEGCYIEEINDVVPFGTKVNPRGYCYVIHCGNTFIDYASCGVVSTNVPHCHVTKTDLRKQYPECCPHIECDSDNDINTVS